MLLALYGPAVEAGTIDVPGLTELSGLAPSRLRDDVLWAHNDSGNEPRLYAIGTDGKSLGSVLVQGATNVDWEDMASFEIDGEAYLVIADIGDNDADRSTVSLLLVREPVIAGDRLESNAVVRVTRRIEFRYDDGPRDAESLGVDTQGDRFLVMSKRQSPSVVYEIPLAASSVVVAHRVADHVNIPRISKKKSSVLGALARYAAQPTSMDISPDGSLVIVQTYTDAFLFRREAGQSWQDVFAAVPERVRIPALRQVEAVAFDRAGKSVFASGEFRPCPLIRVDPYLARSE